MEIIRTSTVTILLVTVVVLAGGCTDNDSQGEPENSAIDNPTVTKTPTANEMSKPELVADDSEVALEASGELNAAHILIMHRDSERVPPGISRTREEALALAQKIALQSQADGADFAALAKEHSDGPSGPGGGNLGNFLPDQMVPQFSEATLKLTIGGVSDPVETQFGYHIIRRQEIQIIPKASAKHILVMHTESLRAPPNITRTKEEAKARIQECLALSRQGRDFEDLAREYSDGPSAPSGGDLGEFPQGVMAPAFEQATFACEVGKITDVVETPFGYHIIFRYK